MPVQRSHGQRRGPPGASFFLRVVHLGRSTCHAISGEGICCPLTFCITLCITGSFFLLTLITGALFVLYSSRALRYVIAVEP